jgi:hypothetical protein
MAERRFRPLGGVLDRKDNHRSIFPYPKCLILSVILISEEKLSLEAWVRAM